jgi:hypothetical protein
MFKTPVFWAAAGITTAAGIVLAILMLGLAMFVSGATPETEAMSQGFFVFEIYDEEEELVENDRPLLPTFLLHRAETSTVFVLGEADYIPFVVYEPEAYEPVQYEPTPEGPVFVISGRLQLDGLPIEPWQQENIEFTLSFLTQNGFSLQAAVAVLSNWGQESSFRIWPPELIACRTGEECERCGGKGYERPYSGAFQILREFAGQEAVLWQILRDEYVDHQSLGSQLQYVVDILHGEWNDLVVPQFPFSGIPFILDDMNHAGSVEEAAMIFANRFLKGTDPHNRRAGWATQLYPQLSPESK